MKKILLTLMVLGITSSSATFGYEVKFMETGAVKNFTPVAFGSNAPWLPGNREMKAQRIREVRRFPKWDFQSKTASLCGKQGHPVLPLQPKHPRRSLP